LVSLNQSTVGRALGLLEGFIGERVQDSRWTHLEVDAADHETVSYPQPTIPPASDQRCPLCRLTGWGEEGMPHVVDLLHQEHFWRQVDARSQ
jgi:hypothetical protein